MVEAQIRALGRPSIYSDELAETICAYIREGMSLRAIQRVEGMPTMTTIMDWAQNNPDFSERYTKAKEIQHEHMAEELLEISDDGSNDWMVTNDPDNPGYRMNGEHFQRSRLRVDTRKWLLSKLAPKKYGERAAVTNNVGSLTVVDGVSVNDINELFGRVIDHEANSKE